MKCLNCGQNHQPEDRFCVQCGAEIIKPDEATQNVPTASTMTEDQQLQSTSKQSQKKMMLIMNVNYIKRRHRFIKQRESDLHLKKMTHLLKK